MGAHYCILRVSCQVRLKCVIVANRGADKISGLCEVSGCLKVHSSGKYVLATEWKDTSKFHASILGSSSVKGWLDTQGE